MRDIQTLLFEAKLISNRYELINKYEKDKFNIFEVLELERNEVRTHSKFISELLNKNSSHQMGAVFFDLFLNVLYAEPNFNSENYSVVIEQHTNDGFIDIFIKENVANPKIIVIENKIDAVDQPRQLKRYHNYCKGITLLENISLVYLTLDGKNPTQESIDDLGLEDIIIISYQNDIIQWLKSCQEKAFNHPSLRETIGQYIQLINKLTNNNMNENEKNEMIALLSKPENINIALDLVTIVPDFKKRIVLDFWETLKCQLTEKLKIKDWSFEIDLTSNAFPKAKLLYKKDETIFLCLEKIYSNIYGGLWMDAKKISKEKREIIKTLVSEKVGKTRQSDYWPYLKPIPFNNSILDFNNNDQLILLTNEDGKKEIEELILKEFIFLRDKFEKYFPDMINIINQ